MSHNDITGAKIATKAATQNYRNGHDRIFGSKRQELCLRCGRAGHMVEDCKMPVETCRHSWARQIPDFSKMATMEDWLARRWQCERCGTYMAADLAAREERSQNGTD